MLERTTTPGLIGVPGVRDAAAVALEALEERAGASRLLLTDRTLHGLADPVTVRRSLGRDEEAARVLRETLGL